MGDRRQQEPPHGKPPHGESEHGPKTHARNIEQLQSGPADEPLDDRLDRDRERGALSGKRRLVEDREQHDEAEKNSELEKDRP